MKIIFTTILYLIFLSTLDAQVSQLKSVIYDFDGLDLGQTDLPDGDYKNFDLDYHIAANPVLAGNALGDRVLELNLNWSGGTGEFGKGITRYIELDPLTDRFNFYFLNPLSNYADAVVDVTIKEDDNQNNVYESTLDDKWLKTVIIPRSSTWQLISLPLSSFTDANSGGNGIFDAGYINDKGKILTTGLTFHRSAAAIGNETYYTDMLCFSEGALPTGTTITDLPFNAAGNHCALGSYAYRSPADSVPPEVEALFPGGNKLRYINIFIPLAYTGTTASALPGAAVQRLMDHGYCPVITWEMMYSAYPPLDPVQPRLNAITNGSFNSYIDAFANAVKLYSDTVIIRLFHEFDGNWYPWSIEENGQDPNSVINAFRYIVDRFNAAGVTNVLWMWSPNSSPVPNSAYNWFVDAYPGDAYVDIISTSIYNHPITGIPPWRSFRSLLAESYYYSQKYFPAKPFIIAESGVREREPGELSSSQTKADWLCAASEDLKSYFCKTKALIFLNVIKEHDWRINSSSAAKEAVRTCMWQDPYFKTVSTNIPELSINNEESVFPNPSGNSFNLKITDKKDSSVIIYNSGGDKVLEQTPVTDSNVGSGLPTGLYIIELKEGKSLRRIKAIKE